ncbi:DNA-3-methyladenine glycosylase I [Parahaliea mediterranea]|uniref:DNA-3-methyladenine glycosylase I n=1 Tax=Parahaliea mediterranea TaxID=651086 RepID=A0A939DGA3_9GAMM|nr:DNA-3-methyladenine glycosylase I [Parahaliea mediterranea]MBN7797674.1 DNA-3-methyladenine glycosylase I [Parahaliea mediterranea]
MQSFSEIHQRAVERQGGKAALGRLLPAVKSPRQLARTDDHRWLSEMARCVFQAGFVWRVVDNKWEGFEEVFFGFPPEKIVMLSPEQIDRFAQNPLIIRNRQKVISVQHNARFVLDTAREHGGFGKFVARWPDEDLVGLFAHLKRHGSRLGGMTGQRVLRNMGRDTFLITGDVARCLRDAGLEIASNPGSKRDLARIQDVFNGWHRESGLPYSHISRICACSL